MYHTTFVFFFFFGWNKNAQSTLQSYNGDITNQMLDSAHNLLFTKWLNILGTDERVREAHTQISSMKDKKKIYINNWGSTHEDLKLIKQKGKFILIPPKQTSNPIHSGAEENQK